MNETEYSTGYRTFMEGVKACLPTVLGYLGIGIAAGVVGKGANLSVLEILLLSVLVYAGSAQFIISGMLVLGSPMIAIVFTTFLVNLRHFLMSLSVASYFKQEKLLPSIGIGTLLTDESYGVLVTALQNGHRVTTAWTNGLNLTAYLSWIFATVLGGIIGDFIPSPEKLGLDFALSAMFIGLIALQIERPMKADKKNTWCLLATVCISLYFFMAIMSPEMSVLCATLLGCGMGVFLHAKPKS